MKKLFLASLLTLVSLVVLADPPDLYDPNHYWNYDQDTDGDAYSSAYASEDIWDDEFEDFADYYASGFAYYSGTDEVDYWVRAYIAGKARGWSGTFKGANSRHASYSRTLAPAQSVNGTGICRYAHASARAR